MSFGQFLLYYIASNLILQFTLLGFFTLRRKYIKFQIEKAFKNGQIQIISADDLENQLGPKDKKTWN